MGVKELIQKYSKPGPRYTSYPTAPHWSDGVGREAYREALALAGTRSEPFSLYVHIPFCESLCYYCGCNTQISSDHSRAKAYVERIGKELQQTSQLISTRKKINQISWGGGTPNFLSVEEMKALFGAISSVFSVEANSEISVEVNPRLVTFAQLDCLRSLGFNRISLGVQDLNAKVQETVHRGQNCDMTENVLSKCRELGFEGINFDIIYGLPFQTIESFAQTVEQVLTMRPDRIALYNYAHLPSQIPHQRILDPFPRPNAEQRVTIFLNAYQSFLKSGYVNIGMDHFALPTDELSRALSNKTLYRDFMGYTVRKGTDLLAVGASAVSEWDCSYFQNLRKANEYEQSVDNSGLATFRGCRITDEDRRRKWVIQHVMCEGLVSFVQYANSFQSSFEGDFSSELPLLEPFFDEHILERTSAGFEVTSMGRLFIRNVAMVFDAYLKRAEKIYSQTV
ncbi:MAG: oxygen-independent coproporphyrinogen III oxidase [Deltaproteobacteria bacterium]|nr:oxygen-independent coproporphyrinogen III oxidase [Deltaproteobacteria bacterium]